MGYELHITRASDWLVAADDPIDQAAWLTLAAGTADLVEAGAVSFADGPSGEVVEYPVYSLGLSDGPSLYWREGEIIVGGSLPEHVPDLAQVAARLGARVLGDEGETYP